MSRHGDYPSPAEIKAQGERDAMYVKIESVTKAKIFRIGLVRGSSFQSSLVPKRTFVHTSPGSLALEILKSGI